ncbi:hypothetical protein BOX15_Mlig012120g1 [Macrostomum lignano]|uniref:GPS domain-containing protein n=1 Tax=Macrostomum lignano TaxID=282301 RepID=A0A267FB00_9PLAT|nr:hypothetical protein BOX15_Mlig012120g1 [Macrostomum lignano]
MQLNCSIHIFSGSNINLTTERGAETGAPAVTSERLSLPGVLTDDSIETPGVPSLPSYAFNRVFQFGYFDVGKKRNFLISLSNPIGRVARTFSVHFYEPEFHLSVDCTGIPDVLEVGSNLTLPLAIDNLRVFSTFTFYIVFDSQAVEASVTRWNLTDSWDPSVNRTFFVHSKFLEQPGNYSLIFQLTNELDSLNRTCQFEAEHLLTQDDISMAVTPMEHPPVHGLYQTHQIMLISVTLWRTTDPLLTCSVFSDQNKTLGSYNKRLMGSSAFVKSYNFTHKVATEGVNSFVCQCLSKVTRIFTPTLTLDFMVPLDDIRITVYPYIAFIGGDPIFVLEKVTDETDDNNSTLEEVTTPPSTRWTKVGERCPLLDIGQLEYVQNCSIAPVNLTNATYALDFGDSSGVVSGDFQLSHLATRLLLHNYSAEGVYRVNVTIWNPVSRSSQVTVVVVQQQISNLTLNCSPSLLEVGHQLSCTATTSSGQGTLSWHHYGMARPPTSVLGFGLSSQPSVLIGNYNFTTDGVFLPTALAINNVTNVSVALPKPVTVQWPLWCMASVLPHEIVSAIGSSYVNVKFSLLRHRDMNINPTNASLRIHVTSFYENESVPSTCNSVPSLHTVALACDSANAIDDDYINCTAIGINFCRFGVYNISLHAQNLLSNWSYSLEHHVYKKIDSIDIRAIFQLPDGLYNVSLTQNFSNGALPSDTLIQLVGVVYGGSDYTTMFEYELLVASSPVQTINSTEELVTSASFPIGELHLMFSAENKVGTKSLDFSVPVQQAFKILDLNLGGSWFFNNQGVYIISNYTHQFHLTTDATFPAEGCIVLQFLLPPTLQLTYYFGTLSTCEGLFPLMDLRYSATGMTISSGAATIDLEFNAPDELHAQYWARSSVNQLSGRKKFIIIVGVCYPPTISISMPEATRGCRGCPKDEPIFVSFFSSTTRLVVHAALNCSTSDSAHASLAIYKMNISDAREVTNSGEVSRAMVIGPSGFALNKSQLIVNPKQLPHGVYRFETTVIMSDEENLNASSSVYVHIDGTPLVASLDTPGDPRSQLQLPWVSQKYSIRLNMFDPDTNETNRWDKVTIHWRCYRRCALPEDFAVDRDGGLALRPDAEDQCLLVDAIVRNMQTAELGDPLNCFKLEAQADMNRLTGVIKGADKTKWQLTPDRLKERTEVYIMAFAKKDSRYGVGMQLIEAVDHNPPILSIRCVTNCAVNETTGIYYFNRPNKLAMQLFISNRDSAYVYRCQWTVNYTDGNSSSGSGFNLTEMSQLQDLGYEEASALYEASTTGFNDENFALNGGAFLMGAQRSMVLIVRCRKSGSTAKGTSFLRFRVNSPPELVGNCSVWPPSGVALTTAFSINCTNASFTDDDDTSLLEYRLGWLRPDSRGAVTWMYQDSQLPRLFYLTQAAFAAPGQYDSPPEAHLQLQVLDSYGAYTTLHFSVQLTAATDKSVCAMFDDLKKILSKKSGANDTTFPIGGQFAAVFSRSVGCLSSAVATSDAVDRSNEVAEELFTLLSNATDSTEQLQVAASLAVQLSQVRLAFSLSTLRQLAAFADQLCLRAQSLSQDGGKGGGRGGKKQLNSYERILELVTSVYSLGESYKTALSELTRLCMPSAGGNSSTSAGPSHGLCSDFTGVAASQVLINNMTHSVETCVSSLMRLATVTGERPLTIPSSNSQLTVARQFTRNFTDMRVPDPAASDGSSVVMPDAAAIFQLNPGCNETNATCEFSDTIIELLVPEYNYTSFFPVATNDSEADAALAENRTLTGQSNVVGVRLLVDGAEKRVSNLTDQQFFTLSIKNQPHDLSKHLVRHNKTDASNRISEFLTAVFVPNSVMQFIVSINVSQLESSNFQFVVLFGFNERPSYDAFSHMCVLPKLNESVDSLDAWTCNLVSNSSFKLFYTVRAFEANTWKHLNVTNPQDLALNLQSIAPGNPVAINYTLYAITSVCSYWNTEISAWSSDGCHATNQSHLSATVCKCNHLTDFVSQFYIPMNEIDFSDSAFLKLDSNPIVFATFLAIFCLYLVILIWARRRDCTDLELAGSIPLPDNEPGDAYKYRLAVCTGFKPSSGTTANVYFVMYGTKGDTGPRRLADPYRPALRTGDVNSFLMTCPQSLGEILTIRVWHNNAGQSPSWYLSKIVVKDLQTDEFSFFLADRWLAAEFGDGRVDQAIPVANSSQLSNSGPLFMQATRRKLADDHLWLSVFYRPPSSRFTRVQRLTCCLTVLCGTMLASIAFYGRNSSNGPTMQLGPITITFQELYVAVISTLLVVPINLLIVGLFRYSLPKVAAEDAEQLRQLQAEERRQASKKWYKRRVSLPWWSIIVGYLVSLASVALCFYFTVEFAGAFGETKALHWVASFFTSVVQSILLVQPAKLLVVALVTTLITRQPDPEEDDYDQPEVRAELLRDPRFVTIVSKPERRRLHPSDSAAAADPLIPDPPDPASLQQARERHERASAARSALTDLIAYLLFLSLLSIAAYGSHDPNAYRLHRTVRNLAEFGLLGSPDRPVPLSSVSDSPSFWAYVNATLLPTLYQSGSLAHDGFALRLGSPRLRQLRSRPVACGAGRLASLIGLTGCQTEFSDGREATRALGGWSSNGGGSSSVVDSWTHRGWAELGGLPVWGRLSSYPGAASWPSWAPRWNRRRQSLSR